MPPTGTNGARTANSSSVKSLSYLSFPLSMPYGLHDRRVREIPYFAVSEKKKEGANLSRACGIKSGVVKQRGAKNLRGRHERKAIHEHGAG